VDALDEEMAKIQTAIWLSDKLARLCRENIRAKKEADTDGMCRISDEIDRLVHSRDFSDAVGLVGIDLFYPDTLRKIRAMLESGEVCSVSEAAEVIAPAYGKQK